MTDSKALIERLRDYGDGDYVQNHHDRLEAADLIETQAREIERLRGLLREAEVKLTDVQGAYATKQYSANLLTRIRAALGETFEDLGQEFEAVWDVNRDKLYEGYTK